MHLATSILSYIRLVPVTLLQVISCVSGTVLVLSKCIVHTILITNAFVAASVILVIVTTVKATSLSLCRLVIGRELVDVSPVVPARLRYCSFVQISILVSKGLVSIASL